jgi:hypothetical protein
MRSNVRFDAQSVPRGMLSLMMWRSRNETHVAWVLKSGSKCVIHTAFFAKRTEKTIDASITTYHRCERALGVMPRRREGAIGVLFPGPDRPAGRRTKTTGPTIPPRQCVYNINILIIFAIANSNSYIQQI